MNAEETIKELGKVFINASMTERIIHAMKSCGFTLAGCEHCDSHMLYYTYGKGFTVEYWHSTQKKTLYNHFEENFAAALDYFLELTDH